jgi:hypothetical protein
MQTTGSEKSIAENDDPPIFDEREMCVSDEV